jgi:two-component system chemotaxis response regulator CheB
MDGLTFLSKLMISHPMPVIMVSALTDEGASKTIEALQRGAVDFVLKPKSDNAQSWEKFSEDLIEKVIASVSSNVRRRITPRPDTAAKAPLPAAGIKVEQKYSADVIIPPKPAKAIRTEASDTLIAIGASTGGTEAIAEILSALPTRSPGSS